jgi:hypothetical protein
MTQWWPKQSRQQSGDRGTPFLAVNERLVYQTEDILPSSETKTHAESVIIQFAIGGEEPFWYEFIRLRVFGLVATHRPVRCSALRCVTEIGSITKHW